MRQSWASRSSFYARPSDRRATEYLKGPVRVLANLFFFFNDTATTEIYTLSLPRRSSDLFLAKFPVGLKLWTRLRGGCVCSKDCLQDRKSTRLNSSHSQISYAVFCLKKKKRYDKIKKLRKKIQKNEKTYN